MSVWAEKSGIPRDTLRKRLEAGWSIDEALTTPAKKYRYAERNV